MYPPIPARVARTQITCTIPGAGVGVGVGEGAAVSVSASGMICPDVTVVVVV